MGMEMVGLNELRAALDERIKPTAAKTVVAKHGSSLQTRMQANAVFTKGYSTGYTRQHITLTFSDGGMTATVEPTSSYSPYLEYGTRYMSAQPFVGPSFNAEKTLFLNDLKKLVR